jgi:hypothetical protein
MYCMYGSTITMNAGLRGKTERGTDLHNRASTWSSDNYRFQWAFQVNTVKRRKTRLIEDNAKCRHLKKLTCKGQVLICQMPNFPEPYTAPPPYTLYTDIQRPYLINFDATGRPCHELTSWDNSSSMSVWLGRKESHCEDILPVSSTDGAAISPTISLALSLWYTRKCEIKENFSGVLLLHVKLRNTK